MQKLGTLLTALLLSNDMSIVVGLHSVQELLTALGVTNVLNTEVHSLLEVAVADNLVNDNTNG